MIKLTKKDLATIDILYGIDILIEGKHLEKLTTKQKTDIFILALKHFIQRRG